MGNQQQGIQKASTPEEHPVDPKEARESEAAQRSAPNRSDASQAERPTTVQEDAGQAVTQLDEPPQAEGRREDA